MYDVGSVSCGFDLITGNNSRKQTDSLCRVYISDSNYILIPGQYFVVGDKLEVAIVFSNDSHSLWRELSIARRELRKHQMVELVGLL